MVFGARKLKYWVLGPSGLHSAAWATQFCVALHCAAFPFHCRVGQCRAVQLFPAVNCYIDIEINIDKQIYLDIQRKEICRYSCICIHIHVHTHIQIHIYIYTYTYTYTCTYMHVHVHQHVHLQLHIHVHIYISKKMYIYIDRG